MIPVLALSLSALAGVQPTWTPDPARYPQQATVDPASCSTCSDAARAGRGVLAIVVPAELRSADDPPSGTDLLLVDADGRAVPFAVARGWGEPERVELGVLPTRDWNVYSVDEVDRPIDGLRFDLPSATGATTVTVYVEEGGEWVRHGEPATVWRHDLAEQDRVPFPPTTGPLLVELEHHVDRFWLRQRFGQGFDGYRRAEASVDEDRLTLPVVDARVEESGWARYTVALPRRLPVASVELHVEGDLFDREAVVVPRAVPDGKVRSGAERVRRIRIGGATVDQVVLAGPDSHDSDELVIYVHADGEEPLDIPEVTVRLEGEEVLVVDPGVGPLTLYAGAPAGTTPVFDDRVALPELARLAEGPLRPGEPSANPGYLPPEVRAGLALPGTEADLLGQRWRHAVSGPSGMVRIPLSAEVLAGARPDHGDLRLVDSDGRQIPFLPRRRPLDHRWPEAGFVRTEEGRRSRLRVAVPEPGVPVATVTLGTDAPLFSRTVTVSRARGSTLEPLRVFHWSGADRPTRLTLEVEQPVGDELIVEIDNGDDPPLPIDSVTLTWPAWELIAGLPDGGAALVYGDSTASAPDYDLALLQDDLVHRATAEASLGPRASLEPPPRSSFDRGVLLGGLGVLVLGLGGLAASLVRGVRDEDGGAVAEPDT